MKAIIILMTLVLMGCSTSPLIAEQPANSLKVVVEELVTKANAGDQDHFKALLDKPHKDQSAKLIEMIKRSEIKKNYEQRFKTLPNEKGRLDYHYLEKKCHFQVDLQKTDGKWEATRIWFCR